MDKAGWTVDFYLSERRDLKAAMVFFRRAMRHHGPPRKTALDGYQSSHRAVADLQEERRLAKNTEVRSCAYLNSIVEQDHRSAKSRTGAMLGFNRSANAALVIKGIEFAQTRRKGQFDIARLTKRVPEDARDLWMAVLVA